MPIMPRAVVKKSRRRFAQCFPKGLFPLEIEQKAHVVPRAVDHRTAKKHGTVAQSLFSRFPPADAASNGAQKVQIGTSHRRSILPDNDAGSRLKAQ
jgi:hypothetical protein